MSLAVVRSSNKRDLHLHFLAGTQTLADLLELEANVVVCSTRLIGDLRDTIAQRRHLSAKLGLSGDAGIELCQLHRQSIDGCETGVDAVEIADAFVHGFDAGDSFVKCLDPGNAFVEHVDLAHALLEVVDLAEAMADLVEIVDPLLHGGDSLESLGIGPR